MKVRTIVAWTLLALAVATTSAHAGAFLIGEQSASATGMADAFTAKADDASAIYYNVAGIAQQRGLHIYAGGMLIIGQSSVGLPDPPAPALVGATKTDTAVVFIPNLYAAYGFPHDLAIGVGVFTNMGLKESWQGTFPGRFVAGYTSLQSVTINPSAAWRPVRWFSFGAGLDITPAQVDLRRSENLLAAESLSRFRGNDTGIGANVGVLFELPRIDMIPPLSLGVSYRSRYDFDFSQGGLRTYSVPLELSPIIHDSVASAALPVPDMVNVAVAMRPVDELFVTVEFDWVGWSRDQSVQLTAQNNPQLDLTIPLQWKDGYAIRVGAEYAFRSWKARIGFAYDWTPVPEATLSPVLPDADRALISGGAHIDLGHGVGIDGAVMGVVFRDRVSTLPELPLQYSTWAVLLSGALTFQWPATPPPVMPQPQTQEKVCP